MRPTVEASMINRPLAALSAMFIALATGATPVSYTHLTLPTIYSV